MRLNKYIAQAGIASRRKADELISAGKVKINGIVCTVLGTEVGPEDRVTVNGRDISGHEEKLVYYALNKPLGYITTTSDEKGRETVLSLLTDVTQRVFPVGRLDADTTGLLIMTNDGKLANHISHPRNAVWKTYEVEINIAISEEKMQKLRNGVDIGGYVTKPAEVRLLKQTSHASLLEVKICEGKNRQIRKMFKAVDAKVIALERTAIGEVRLGRTHPGTYRKLTKSEIDYLKNC
ncbi:MAG: rRNA pseudouridine synthase [Firmicutes bacterium]|nr:rRNA pseudouridine synthase [Bacillota bacterium]